MVQSFHYISNNVMIVMVLVQVVLINSFDVCWFLHVLLHDTFRFDIYKLDIPRFAFDILCFWLIVRLCSSHNIPSVLLVFYVYCFLDMLSFVLILYLCVALCILSSCLIPLLCFLGNTPLLSLLFLLGGSLYILLFVLNIGYIVFGQVYSCLGF